MTANEKVELIDIIKNINVKEMEIEHADPTIEKWFRFGNFNALHIVCEVIKALPESDMVS